MNIAAQQLPNLTGKPRSEVLIILSNQGFEFTAVCDQTRHKKSYLNRLKK